MLLVLDNVYRLYDRPANDYKWDYPIPYGAQVALQRTIVYFGSEKNLVEVELQYQQADWDLVAYEQFLESARQRLEDLYGPATVLAKDKKPEGDVMQTIVGYEWKKPASSIQLFFYSAERNTEIYRSVSLHYRAG